MDINAKILDDVGSPAANVAGGSDEQQLRKSAEKERTESACQCSTDGLGIRNVKRSEGGAIGSGLQTRKEARDRKESQTTMVDHREMSEQSTLTGGSKESEGRKRERKVC